MCANLDGSNLTVLVKTGATDEERLDETRQCVGIAIDTKQAKIYWTQKGPSDGGKGRIFRAGIQLPAGEEPGSRSDVDTLFEGLPEPIDLEFDAKAGYLYWTDRGNLPHGNSLSRAKVTETGCGPQEVLAEGLLEGIGLACAHDTNAIFTTDLGGFLRRCDGPDFNTRVIVTSMKKPLTGIAYTEKA